MEILNHSILSLNILFDSIEVIGSLSKVRLLQPINRILSLLGVGENIFDSICNDEILIRLKSMNWLINCLRNRNFFMLAIIREILRYMKRVLRGGRVSLPIVPVCFLRNVSGAGLRSPLTCPSVFVSPNSVWACSPN